MATSEDVARVPHLLDGGQPIVVLLAPQARLPVVHRVLRLAKVGALAGLQKIQNILHYIVANMKVKTITQ